MAGYSLTLAVAVLCLVAGSAGVWLISRLARRPRPTLGAKFGHLFVGLVIVEGLSVPALIVSIAGDDLFGLVRAGAEPWILLALYLSLTGYAIGRLFPWREIDAMANDPDVSLRDAMASLKPPKSEADEPH